MYVLYISEMELWETAFLISRGLPPKQKHATVVVGMQNRYTKKTKELFKPG